MPRASDSVRDRDADSFEAARPRLFGLAYRILGSRADAEDAVQDTYLKWIACDRDSISSPAAWLTTVCTRRCLDLSRAANRTRVDYVGTWLPEPVHTSIAPEAERNLELASSLTTAFLLLLDRLTPKERAAYLLREIFDVPYAEIAQTLEIGEAACRKLVSRAKSNIDRAEVRHSTPVDEQERLLAAFRDAITSGEAASLSTLLSKEIRLSADGGGKVPTIFEPIDGAADVTTFLTGPLHGYWSGYAWIVAELNGARGYLLRDDDVVVAAVSFSYSADGKARGIYIVRNPDKLARLADVALN